MAIQILFQHVCMQISLGIQANSVLSRVKSPMDSTVIALMFLILLTAIVEADL